MVEARSVAPAAVFAALGDPTRLTLVKRLSDGRPRSVVELGEGLPLTRQAVTKHLRVLEQAGVISRDRRGRLGRFRYEPAVVDDARRYLAQVSAHWDDALARLQDYLEE
jgi:DNA-binding transcriptional ArsR family regulator